MMTVERAFQIALQHHQSGRLADAEAIYRQILAVEPRHADALHLLGAIANQAGQHASEIELIGKGLNAGDALEPSAPSSADRASRSTTSAPR